MIGIARKEIIHFFGNLSSYILLGFYIVILGLLVWVFPVSSFLTQSFVQIDSLYEYCPLLLMFLIPALTMNSFSKEFSVGTFAVLQTQSISMFSIIFGKFIAYCMIVSFLLLPYFFYWWSLGQLVLDPNSLDHANILSALIGLTLLSYSFVAMGLFASSLHSNPIMGFLVALILCFAFTWGFQFISELPLFYGGIDYSLKQWSLLHHFDVFTQGVIESKSIFHFASISLAFLFFCQLKLDSL